MAERNRGANIAVWVVSGLLCALYLFASSGKLLSDPQAAEGFRKVVIMLGAVYTHLSNNDAVHMGTAVIALVLLAFFAYVRRTQALLVS